MQIFTQQSKKQKKIKINKILSGSIAAALFFYISPAAGSVSSRSEISSSGKRFKPLNPCEPFIGCQNRFLVLGRELYTRDIKKAIQRILEGQAAAAMTIDFCFWMI